MVIEHPNLAGMAGLLSRPSDDWSIIPPSIPNLLDSPRSFHYNTPFSLMHRSSIMRSILQALLIQLDFSIYQTNARPTPTPTLILSQLKKAHRNFNFENHTHPALVSPMRLLNIAHILIDICVSAINNM